MRYMYDTEFEDNGKTIDFISIGIVAEDGREYYAVSNEFNTKSVSNNQWLMDNVMKSIAHDAFVTVLFEGAPIRRDLVLTDPAARSRFQIAKDIFDFIKDDPNPQFWAWYSAYDHVCLAQLFGKMIDLPDKVPMYTNDIKTLCDLAGNPKMPKQSAGLHNALADAKFNVVRYDYVMERLTEKLWTR